MHETKKTAFSDQIGGEEIYELRKVSRKKLTEINLLNEQIELRKSQIKGFDQQIEELEEKIKNKN